MQFSLEGPVTHPHLCLGDDHPQNDVTPIIDECWDDTLFLNALQNDDLDLGGHTP